ncbi:MAG: DUF4394 domain-containing protein [Planctomycetes bacterium]|nr:DUF4394 domain-containing protein [Planctomycetota bacterium]
MRISLFACALVATGVSTFCPSSSAEILWLVADGNFLVKVDSLTPGTLLQVKSITGLPPGVDVVGVDFRPGTGSMYGVAIDPALGGAATYVRIDPRTGAASLSGAGAFNPATTGAGFGIDFNPVADLLRVVDDTDLNQRVDPATGALFVNDTALDLATVDEQVVAVAYDRSVGNALATTLYGIDRVGSQLVTIGGIDGSPSPNDGVLTAIGVLGVTVGDEAAGFDISSQDGDAFVSLVDSSTGVTNLYSLDLGTGTATSIGSVGNGAARYAGLAIAPQGRLAFGAEAGKGEGPTVKVHDAQSGLPEFQFSAFDATFNGGVRVALGDVTGDGVADAIVGSGAKGGPRVRVFDGVTGTALGAPLGDFQAFQAPFKGGVFVAAGDVNGDGRADIIVGPDKGKGADAHVKVFSGLDGSTLQSFLVFTPKFANGVRVASADFNADGLADIVAAPGKGAPEVFVLDGANAGIPLPTAIGTFLAFSPKTKGGVRVAAGDVTGDGVPDVVASSGRRVHTIDGATGSQVLGPAGDFLSTLKGSVHVAAGDVDGDGICEILIGAGSGKGNGPKIQIVESVLAAPVSVGALPLVPFASNFKGGVTIAFAAP